MNDKKKTFMIARSDHSTNDNVVRRYFWLGLTTVNNRNRLRENPKNLVYGIFYRSIRVFRSFSVRLERSIKSFETNNLCANSRINFWSIDDDEQRTKLLYTTTRMRTVIVTDIIDNNKGEKPQNYCRTYTFHSLRPGPEEHLKRGKTRLVITLRSNTYELWALDKSIDSFSRVFSARLSNTVSHDINCSSAIYSGTNGPSFITWVFAGA